MAKEYKSGKKYYDENDKNNAKSVDLADFIESRWPGEIEYSKEKKTYRRADNHSIHILNRTTRNNVPPFMTWCDYGKSRENLGDNINYLQQFHEMSFTDAVAALLSFGNFTHTDFNEKQKIYYEKKKEFEKNSPRTAPPKNETYLLRLYDYLCHYRCINKEIIDDCIKKNILYTDNRGNCVFLNPETNFYFIRNCDIPVIKVPFRQSCGGIGYWLYMTDETKENIEKIYICESPIDCLSLCDLQERPPHTAYIAMLGLKPENAKKAIEDFKNAVPEIAVDWDKYGIKFHKEHFPEIKFLHAGKGYIKETKDWNEMLQYVRRS